MRIVGCIPARYSSTRFPGKVLAKDTGKFLIQHTYERACAAELLDSVVIATDDEKVVAAAKKILPPDIFAEQFLGKRVRRSGLIYKEFDPDKHVRPLPTLDEIANMRLSVSFDTDRKKLLEIIKVKGMTWRHYYDGLGPDNRIGLLYGVDVLPRTILIGKDGLVAFMNPKSSTLMDRVRELVKKDGPDHKRK